MHHHGHDQAVLHTADSDRTTFTRPGRGSARRLRIPVRRGSRRYTCGQAFAEPPEAATLGVWTARPTSKSSATLTGGRTGSVPDLQGRERRPAGTVGGIRVLGNVRAMGDARTWQVADRHLIRYAGRFHPRVIERAAGSYMYDTDGNAILVFTSGQMSAVLGHSHPDIVAAVARSVATLDHIYSGMISPPLVELAESIAATLPPSLSKIQLLTTGAESNEAALKIAK